MKKNSLKTRFVAVFSSFIFFSFAIIIVMSALAIVKVGSTYAENQAGPVIAKAIGIIDGDEFERICGEMDDSDAAAEEIRLSLLDMVEAVGCRYLFTMKPAGGTNYTYVIDGSCDPSDEENFSPMGTEENIDGWGRAPFEAYETDTICYSGLKKQELWGWQFSCYGPIKNSSGRTVGIVGVDFDVTFLMKTIIVQVIFLAVLGLLLVIIGGLLIYFLTGLIFGALHKVSEAMYSISRGSADLTQRVPEQNNLEVGSLAVNCNLVIQRLNDLVTKLQKESGVLKDTSDGLAVRMESHIMNINSASDGISEIDGQVSSQKEMVDSVSGSVERMAEEVKSLGEKITDQTHAIEQSSSAIEEISANIESVGNTVTKISGEYANLVAQSVEGNKIQQEVSDQIDKIAKQSENLNEANEAIASIADQTNLLAMNAAIEAAHAGDLGKGFSVVADEIRALAETSANQSRAISELLDGITEAISGIVNSSQLSSKAFENVGSKISEMDNLMKEIQRGMDEETAGVGNILDMMKVLNGTTHAIDDASDAMKAESEKVFGQVNELKALAEATHVKSADVANSMLEINIGAQDASNSSVKNQSAANHIVAMITGFKVGEAEKTKE